MDVTLTARNGREIPGDITREADGSITIVSEWTAGYRSAHRRQAQSMFPGRLLWRAAHVSWRNASGTRVALTRWHTEKFRQYTLRIERERIAATYGENIP